MLPILTPEQIRQVEELSCRLQGISMNDLMERAGKSFCDWFITKYGTVKSTINIFCGNGNNGGDGLVIARLLAIQAYTIRIFIIPISGHSSTDFIINKQRMLELNLAEVHYLNDSDDLPIFSNDEICIDAILGTGNTRPIDDSWTKLVVQYNNCEAYKISIDLPSGIPANGSAQGLTINSDLVFGFEFPKLAYLLVENAAYIKSWTLGSIGLSSEAIQSINVSQHYIQESDIVQMIKPRPKFGYKNIFGHVGVIAGSRNMCGAGILTSKACLRTGAGLVSVFLDEDCRLEQYAYMPEIMQRDRKEFWINPRSEFNSLVIGPGLKAEPNIKRLVETAINSHLPCILDAEAINELARTPDLRNTLDSQVILTPHIGEFENLVGIKFHHSLDRIKFAVEYAKQQHCILILKGAYSCIFTPDGKYLFNSTGNQGMATAGSGDVLAGMIGAMLAQNYSTTESAILGCYIHGLAGDFALKTQSFESLIASDIIQEIGNAFNHLRTPSQH